MGPLCGLSVVAHHMWARPIRQDKTQTLWPVYKQLNTKDKAKTLIIKHVFVVECSEMPHFAAPEIVQGAPYGRAIDVWATGILLYLLLSGNLPFCGTRDQLLNSASYGSYSVWTYFISTFFSSTTRDHFLFLLWNTGWCGQNLANCFHCSVLKLYIQQNL